MRAQKQQPAINTVTCTISINVGTYDNIPFEFTYRTDGTGTAKDLQYGEDEVSFTWNPAILDDLNEEEIQEALSDHASELFWDEINDQLREGRVLQATDYTSGDLTFENGSEEELEHIVRLTAYSFPVIWEDDRNDVALIIRARTESEEAHLDQDYGLMEDVDISDDIKTHLEALIALALKWIDPYGWLLEYNDGSYGRASGYYELANTLNYTISRPSFHELAEARWALLQVFAKHGFEEDARQLLSEGE